MGRPQIPITDRMWKYIVVDENDCWLWNGNLYSNGYGQTKVAGYPMGAHRAVYQALVGEIPQGLELDHLCSTKNCVNPTHLEPVTGDENKRRYAESIKFCPSGHGRETSLRVSPSGARYCHDCRMAYQRKYRARVL